MIKQRDTHFDWMRFCATMAVVISHTSAKHWNLAPLDSGEWWIVNFNASLLRCSVPIFLMLSGIYILSPSYPFTLEKLWKKNMFRIATAFLFWSPFYAWFHWARGYLEYDINTLQRQLLTGNYHLWYLYTLAGLYLGVPVYRKIAEDKKILEYFIALCFVTGGIVPLLLQIPQVEFIASGMISKTNFHFALGYSGYFLLGYYLHTYPLSQKKRQLVYIAGVSALLFTVLVTNFVSQAEGQQTTRFYTESFPNTFLFGLCVFVLFQQSNPTEKQAKFFSKVNRLSFGIYLVHDFYLVVFLEELNWLGYGLSPLIGVPVFGLTVYVASAFTTFILSKIPFIGKYIV